VESEQLVLIWDQYEHIAMHFNGLLIHLRTQALGDRRDSCHCGGLLTYAISQ
jgi:hypothetical protein